MAKPPPLMGLYIDGYQGRVLMRKIEALQQQNADLVAALGRLVLAFDVGDMAHTTLNGRGYSALADARPLLAKAGKG